MIDIVDHPHVELRENGISYIKQSHISVYALFRLHKNGMPFVQIVRRYPKLSASQVLDALSFAYDYPMYMNEEEKHWNQYKVCFTEE